MVYRESANLRPNQPIKSQSAPPIPINQTPNNRRPAPPPPPITQPINQPLNAHTQPSRTQKPKQNPPDPGLRRTRRCPLCPRLPARAPAPSLREGTRSVNQSISTCLFFPLFLRGPTEQSIKSMKLDYPTLPELTNQPTNQHINQIYLHQPTDRPTNQPTKPLRHAQSWPKRSASSWRPSRACPGGR